MGFQPLAEFRVDKDSADVTWALQIRGPTTWKARLATDDRHHHHTVSARRVPYSKGEPTLYKSCQRYINFV